MYSKTGKKINNAILDEKLILLYPEIKRESDYINTKTPIKFSCRRCGKIFIKKPKEIKRVKCKCLDREKNYKDLIKSKNIELVENYINTITKIRHRCKSCNLEFISSPKSIVNSKIGCPSCSGKIFSIEKYKSLLPDNIEIISSEYIGSNYKHLHKCKLCESEFETKPNYILHMKTNCPICSMSKGEKVISSLLDKMLVNYKKEYPIKINNKKLRFDFFIEDLEIFIEFDGVQHFKPVSIFGGNKYLEKIKEYDSLKDEWCEKNGFHLIRVPYNSDNIEEFLVSKIYGKK